jgi:hypothetical protein
VAADQPPERNEFIRGPKWRTRTSAPHRHRAAAFTVALIVAGGTLILTASIWVLALLGAPVWVASLPWALPTIAMIAWALIRPTPAVATDDDDDSWTIYSIEYVIIGEGSPRPAPARLITALVVGAPIVWCLAVFGLSTLAGLF